MKKSHAAILVILAVIAGGVLFMRMHNPDAFDEITTRVGGLLSGSPPPPPVPAPKPALPAKLALPAVKAIEGENDKVTALSAENSASEKPASTKQPPVPVSSLAVGKPVAAPSPPPKPTSPEMRAPPAVPPASASAPAVTPTPYSPAPSSGSSSSFLLNSPSDVINAPAPPPPAATNQPATDIVSTPVMSAAPIESVLVSAAMWTPPSPTPAEPNWTWTTTDGQVYKKVRVLKMSPKSVTILHEDGGASIPLGTLPPDLQQKFNYSEEAAAQWGVGELVAGNLVALKNGILEPVDDAVLRPARYIALYYSAMASLPSAAFTPKLVKFYNDFKAAHPQFEVIFISEDRSPSEMALHMRQASMPWLAVSYGALVHPPGQFKGSGIEAFAGAGIPDLVLLDATGRVLSDSYRDGKYVGPDEVMNDIPALVK